MGFFQICRMIEQHIPGELVRQPYRAKGSRETGTGGPHIKFVREKMVLRTLKA